MPKRHEPIKWTVDSAAREFGVDDRSLSGLLRRAGLEPINGAYTTSQICQAIYGDLEAEKIRTERARADLLEIELAEKRGRMIDAEAYAVALEKFCGSLRDCVQAMVFLPQENRDEICKKLAETGMINGSK